jgi:hypothetical protein
MVAPIQWNAFQTMDLILRTFLIDEEMALRLSNRASYEKKAPSELVREHVEAYVSSNSWSIIQDNTEGMALRSYHITREQDILLDVLANKFHTTKGNVFRSAIAEGMGISKRGIK